MRYLFLLILTLTACNKPTLSVRSEYYGRNHLASVHVDTPDARKESHAFGQRLMISWSVSESTFEEGSLELIVQVALKNGEIKTSKVVLTQRQGQTFYPVFGKDYTKKGGIESYRVELQSKGQIVAKSQHKLWVERIKITQSTSGTP
jgi:hypothetical protein